MRLRSQLVLFFGLVMGIIAAALVGLTEHQTRTNLLRDIREGMASGRYEAHQQEIVKQLHLLSYQVGERTSKDHIRFVTKNGALDQITKGKDFNEVIARLSNAKQDGPEVWSHKEFQEAKASPSDRAYNDCYTALLDLAHDVGPEVMRESGGVLDFLGMTDRQGRVLIILTSEADGSAPSPEKPTEAPKVAPGLQSLIDDSTEEQNGYVVHSDGLLYLMNCVSFRRGGKMLLGYRIDERNLKAASLHSVSDLAVVVGDKVMAPSTPQLSDALKTVKPEDGVQELTLAEHRYLVSSVPLQAQLSTKQSPTVARAFNLRSLASVELYLSKMTEGIAGVGIISLLAGIIGIRVLSGRVTNPIERLSAKMERVGAGDLTQKMEAQGSFEVQQAGYAFNHMVEDLRQKEMLAKMVPKQAREAIAKADVVGGRVAGRRLKTTILFSDIRGFTSLSERLSPSEVMGLLDIYLSRMTTVIESHGGDVNEYIGDAILADFEDHDGVSGAGRAVKAAYEMTKALTDLKSQDLNPHLKDLRQGIGLNTGELVKGEIGASDRSKFAMVGDAVNLAARIQDRSREGRHTCIMLSDATYQEAGSDFEFSMFGEEEFKGKTGKTRVWEVTAPVARSGAIARPDGGKPPTASA